MKRTQQILKGGKTALDITEKVLNHAFEHMQMSLEMQNYFRSLAFVIMGYKVDINP